MNPKGMENQMGAGEERKVNFYRKSPRGIETGTQKEREDGANMRAASQQIYKVRLTNLPR